MRYGYISNGTVSIKSAQVFCDALQNRNPLTITDFVHFLQQCEALVRTEFLPTTATDSGTATEGDVRSSFMRLKVFKRCHAAVAIW